MSQLQNKNVRKLKNIVHIAVHFPMGTSKVCNKISIRYKIKYLLKRVPKIAVDIEALSFNILAMCNELDRMAFCIWRIIDSHLSPTVGFET